MSGSKTVYIVHCVDTEGPLYQGKSVSFEMIKNIFGLEIEQTNENLRKLQNGDLYLDGQEEAIKELVAPHRIATRGTWEEIDNMLKLTTSEEYRNKLLDSNGKGWVFNWFCMAHEGFTGKNPRRRVEGFHAVRDHYCALISKQKSPDLIGFHYHPVSISGNYNDSGTAYWGTDNVSKILCHLVIDRMWFPAVFRPGFHTERPDSNWFLEQWIPFDYANQAMKSNIEGQLDMANGRFGDWRYAPTEWRPYHPSHDDYQKKGNCRRYITRCLNMYARTRQISQTDVDDAFIDAQRFGSSILAFTDHDYKDMEFEIDRIREMIEDASKRYRDVKFIYTNAIDAMRKCNNMKYEEFEMEVKIVADGKRKYLDIKVDKDIFGPQPYLAIKTKNGDYYWDNLDFYNPGREWTYSFDNNTVSLTDLDTIGVAANNTCGFTRVSVIRDTELREYTYNQIGDI